MRIQIDSILLLGDGRHPRSRYSSGHILPTFVALPGVLDGMRLLTPSTDCPESTPITGCPGTASFLIHDSCSYDDFYNAVLGS